MNLIDVYDISFCRIGEFSLDDMTLNICSIVSLLTKSPMKQRFLMDSL